MKRVACGKSHTLWIDTKNNVWGAGRGICTGLGSGDTNELLAQRIPNFKAINIAAGEAILWQLILRKRGSFIPGVSEVLVP